MYSLFQSFPMIAFAENAFCSSVCNVKKSYIAILCSLVIIFLILEGNNPLL